MGEKSSIEPRLECRVARNPLGGEGDYYLVLGVTNTAEEADSRTRSPMDLMLAVDRSSSMVGSRIASAVEAVRQIYLRLDSRDRVGVVAFDADVQVVRKPGRVDEGSASEVALALMELGVGYGTNLSAGWQKAVELISRGGIPGVGKTVVLITDGLPSVGMRSVEELSELVRSGQRLGIVTDTVGVGDLFDEELLSKMATAGGGVFRLAERDEDTIDIAGELVEGLTAVGAESAVIHLGFSRSVQSYEVVHEVPCRAEDDGIGIELGRLFFDRPRSILLELAVEPGTSLMGVAALTYKRAGDASGEDETLEPVRIELPSPEQEEAVAQQIGAVVVPQRVAQWQRKIWEHGRDRSTAPVKELIREARADLERLPESFLASPQAREAIDRFTDGCERILAALAILGDDEERGRQTSLAYKSMAEETQVTIAGYELLPRPSRHRRGWGRKR